jgi:hypothetical protein
MEGVLPAIEKVTFYIIGTEFVVVDRFGNREHFTGNEKHSGSQRPVDGST